MSSPPPNTPLSAARAQNLGTIAWEEGHLYTEKPDLVVEEAYCPVEDLIKFVNDLARMRWEINHEIMRAYKVYLDEIKNRRFQRLW
jgi:hypothetical protein